MKEGCFELVLSPRKGGVLLGDQERLGANKHICVVFGGVQESGDRPGPRIRGFMQLFGDFMFVKYPFRGSFNLKRAARLVLDQLAKYDEATLIGISGGAKLAQEVIRLAIKLRPELFLRLILDSAPADVGTLQPGQRIPALASLIVSASLLPSNPRFCWWFYGATTGATPDILPPHDALNDSDEASLRAHHIATNERPPGSFIREARTLIVRAPKPDPMVLCGISAVYIISENDNIVAPAAFGKWNEAIEGTFTTLPRITVQSEAHADHLSYPGAWLAAYTRAFLRLGLKPR